MLYVPLTVLEEADTKYWIVVALKVRNVGISPLLYVVVYTTANVVPAQWLLVNAGIVTAFTGSLTVYTYVIKVDGVTMHKSCTKI